MAKSLPDTPLGEPTNSNSRERAYPAKYWLKMFQKTCNGLFVDKALLLMEYSRREKQFRHFFLAWFSYQTEVIVLIPLPPSSTRTIKKRNRDLFMICVGYSPERVWMVFKLNSSLGSAFPWTISDFSRENFRKRHPSFQSIQSSFAWPET